MRPAWLTGMCWLWFGVTVVTVICEGTWIGATEASILTRLMKPNFAQGGVGLPLIDNVIGFFYVVRDYLVALFDILTWNYTFVTGVWVFLRYLASFCSIATIWAMITSIRGS